MAIPLGIDAKAYYWNATTAPATVSVSGTPTATDATRYNYLSLASDFSATELVEAECITDVTLSLSKSEADLTCRKSGGWRITRGTLKEGTISFDVFWDPDDDFSTAVLSAWLGNSLLTMLFVDQIDTTQAIHGQGVYADFDVIGFEKTEPLEDGQKFAVTLKVSQDTLTPDWVAVRA